ncbi:multidrug resistance efflux pump [Kroppenstedtia sanguinis]|uniref:HlyD family secretion protein n=1 Tax=Kroppenstedtia sanguinis TaxID=1380684 RepID=A0ABW4C9Q6_9BACL
MRRSFVWGSILALFLLAGIGGGIYYGYQQLNYVSSDIAQVSAPSTTITADTTGRLDWKVHSGDVVQADEVIGSLSPIPSLSAAPSPLSSSGKSNPSGGSPDQEIKSPIRGTILESIPASKGITTGEMPLAMIADLSKLHILAYVDESDIAEVKKGQQAEIHLDAEPGITFQGKVDRIGNQAGKPGSDASSTGSTKEVQRVPVYIDVDFQDHEVVYGMNAVVKIHKS